MPYYRADKQDYIVWRSQPVWYADTKCERREIITEFASSIRVWMKSLGYTMEERLTKELSLWMYRLYVQEIARRRYGEPVYIPEPNHRNTQDDYDRYNMIVDTEAVMNFMDEWSHVEDMDVDSIIGKRIRYELQEFLYYVLDLESSKQGRVVARIWDNSGSNSDTEYEHDKKGDVYMEEAKKGMHGGRGSKV
jgi:hypothetical protein